MRRLLSYFFFLLYHHLAWAYDGVAWLVSGGHWDDWTKSILPMIPDGRVLELGFGPGHLQKKLREGSRYSFGIDESWPMCKMAMRKYPGLNILRGTAQSLPFPSSSFDAVFATFPAPFIFQDETAQEILRVLVPGGKLVALLATRPDGNDFASWLIRLLFRVTGEAPRPHDDFLRFLVPYQNAGFKAGLSWTAQEDISLFVLGCVKMMESVDF